MKICYTSRNFSTASLRTIQTANQILEEYAAQGYDLTLRQLYYQFVSRDLIANKDTEYKKLGSVINDARLAGLIDWAHIIDRTRNMKQNAHWNSPREIVEACAIQFEIDKWKDQKNYIEVWVEKDALVGVLEVACRPLDIAYFSCRGYTSQSEMWAAGQRLLEKMRAGKDVTVLHLGDHDPSGIDMSRDIEDRLLLFLTHHILRDLIKGYPREDHETEDDVIKRIQDMARDRFELGFSLKRIALNKGQIDQYNPPPNPAKLTDSRSASYVDNYGDESWELDALEPAVITALIQDEVEVLRDETLWEAAVETEQIHRAHLKAIAKGSL